MVTDNRWKLSSTSCKNVSRERSTEDRTQGSQGDQISNIWLSNFPILISPSPDSFFLVLSHWLFQIASSLYLNSSRDGTRSVPLKVFSAALTLGEGRVGPFAQNSPPTPHLKSVFSLLVNIYMSPAGRWSHVHSSGHTQKGHVTKCCCLLSSWFARIGALRNGLLS